MGVARDTAALPRLAEAAPRIDGARCLLGRAAISRCAACADVCPPRALIAGADGLGLNEAACTGCGRCVAACPEAAIDLPRPATARVERAGRIVFIACQPAASEMPRQAAAAPCLHGFGLRDLAAWRKEGAARILALRGDCDACAHGGGPRLAATAALFSDMLESRGLPRLAYAEATASDWRARFAATDPAPAPGALSRRGLLAMLSPAAEATPPAAETDFPGLPAGDAAAMAAFAPQIAPEACTGCDACVRICPHGAISLADEAYRLAPAHCTHCRLCVDICEEGAVEIKAGGRNGPTIIPLSSHRCIRCGAPFHQPALEGAETSLCRICRRVNHHSNLHQVLT